MTTQDAERLLLDVPASMWGLRTHGRFYDDLAREAASTWVLGATDRAFENEWQASLQLAEAAGGLSVSSLRQRLRTLPKVRDRGAEGLVLFVASALHERATGGPVLPSMAGGEDAGLQRARVMWACHVCFGSSQKRAALAGGFNEAYVRVAMLRESPLKHVFLEALGEAAAVRETGADPLWFVDGRGEPVPAAARFFRQNQT